jgi:hypothetical protein
MLSLPTVHDYTDGSPGIGYRECLAVACEGDEWRVVPLHWRFWSLEAPDSVSQSAMLFRVMDTPAADRPRGAASVCRVVAGIA